MTLQQATRVVPGALILSSCLALAARAEAVSLHRGDKASAGVMSAMPRKRK